MPVSPDLLEILVCPETKQAVAPAPAELLEELNRKIEARTLRKRGGDRVTDRITDALLREDGKLLYVVEDDIPVMLVEESIELSNG